MAIGGFFSKRTAAEPAPEESLRIAFIDDGVVYELPGTPAEDWLARPFAFPGVEARGAWLNQLYLDGLGQADGERLTLPWKQVYAYLGDPADVTRLASLALPPLRALRPVLGSQGSLAEPEFRVVISHWVDEQGVPMRQPPKLSGACARVHGEAVLLPSPVWSLLAQLRSFHAAPVDQRTQDFNEQAWARLRRWATQAQAPLSNYLEKTIVVTPEKLRLDYRRMQVDGDAVVEVVPSFEGAPKGWLDLFDRMQLQPAYSVPDGAAMTRVVLSDPVKKVLAEIKRMPGRRAAGARAEALIANPLSVLGDGAAEVVDAEQVEQALVDAGLSAYRFQPMARRDESGVLRGVSLLVDSGAEAQPQASGISEEAVMFDDIGALESFCQRLGTRLRAGHQWCSWDGLDFELLPESADHLRQLRAWLTEWKDADLWRPEDLFDLSHYSERVAEIGVEKPYALPFVQRRAVELDWFVQNVLYGLMVRPPGAQQPTLVKVEEQDMPAMRQAVDEARTRGESAVLLPGAPAPIPIADAEQAVAALERAQREVSNGEFDPRPQKPDQRPDPGERPERKQLVIKSNIDIVDHAEERSGRLSMPADAAPRLPACLRPQTQLKQHQLEGVAWLLHLWGHSPTACRGALLADDMGLGKTLQLLTFIASCLEEEADLPPVLVIAPVALLENWRAEAARFFEAKALPILTLYGSSLANLRVPRDQISEQLTQHGITKLLRKNWVGDARIVLTTYETLRDLEFTLAAQPWSIMVCDEAQKIKNPSAMVTRAAKKQNVRFRIACTGTPVENSLLDLWCLFDFIQPGLLGALSQFQRTYKQPIEAKTEAQRARVEELRRLIQPQTLRRTKQEVARDSLPAKLEDRPCRALPMSTVQLEHYWAALDQLKRQKETNPSAVLQTLHHIRRICSDPHWQRPEAALAMPVERLAGESPKLRWLLKTLSELKQKSRSGGGEKVIVFCEFRDLQTLLQRVIRERFDLDAYVVNGDTSASLEVENSRQKLIDRFQAAPGFGVIILSPLAVGFGVNIQAANHVVHFTRTWNPAKEDQATDRAYRIGQNRDVTVYYPSVVGEGFESFDAVLHKLLTWKRELAGDMLNASGDLSAADFDQISEVPAGH